MGKKTKPGELSVPKKRIYDALIKYVSRSGELPTLTNLREMGVIRDSVHRHYGGLAKLFEAHRDVLNKYLGKPTYHPNTKKELVPFHQGVHIITSHQNDTKVNSKFLASLLTLKKHLKAELTVIPTYYQTRSAMSKMEPVWSPELNKYYRSTPFMVNQFLEVCAGLPINATAENPLSGLHAVTGQASSVIPHPQIQWEYVSVPANSLPKVMMTTGSISVKNYTRTKAGAKGAFHHSNAALVIYVDGDTFYPMIVNCDKTGGFYHLNHYYSGDEIFEPEYGYGLTLGDLHCEWMDPKVKEATWLNEDSICKYLPIVSQVYHDVVDFNVAGFHHNKNDQIYSYALKKAGKGGAEWSLRTTSNVMRELMENSPHTDKFYIVESNHHDHLYKYLNEVEPKSLSPDDRVLYHELWLKILNKCFIDETNSLHEANPLKAYFDKTLPMNICKKLKYIGANDELFIYSVDNSQHGHKGPNGARGSIEAFTKSNYKLNIGHSHTAGYRKGVLQVGHCGYHKRNYNSGFSSWTHLHGLTYPNGKRTPLIILDGEWLPAWAK